MRKTILIFAFCLLGWGASTFAQQGSVAAGGTASGSGGTRRPVNTDIFAPQAGEVRGVGRTNDRRAQQERDVVQTAGGRQAETRPAGVARIGGVGKNGTAIAAGGRCQAPHTRIRGRLLVKRRGVRDIH